MKAEHLNRLRKALLDVVDATAPLARGGEVEDAVRQFSATAKSVAAEMSSAVEWGQTDIAIQNLQTLSKYALYGVEALWIADGEV